MEPEFELILYVLIVFSIGCGLFYGTAFVVQRVRLLWIEIDSNRIDMLAKRASVKMALDESDLKTQVIALDANGLAPISRRMIDSGLTTEATLQAMLAFIESQRTHAPTAHTLTWSPHYSNKSDGAQLVEPAALLGAPAFTPKDFFQLYRSGELPMDKFLIGYDLEDGTPTYATWGQLYSCLIGGLSGMGKSTLIRNLLAQSALQGGKFVVLDPHYASGDESLGASLAPLNGQMLREVAHDDKTMSAALKFLADTGKRRLEGKDKDRSPLVLIVDETTALLQRGNIAEQLISVLEMIAQETRKVNVYAMCIGQNFSAEVMKSTARNSFVSMISCRARRSVARIQSDSPEFGRMAQELEIGQVVWMAPSGEIKKIAVPNTTAQHLAAVNTVLSATKTPSGIWDTSGEESGLESGKILITNKHLESAGNQESNQEVTSLESENILIIDASMKRALAMFASGKDFSEIIPTVWAGTSKGQPYQNKIRELQSAIRSQMGGA